MATKTVTERLLKQTESLKENNKHKKAPFQPRHLQPRPPLQPANAIRHGQQSRMSATAKQSPTGQSNKKMGGTGKKQRLMATDKCTSSGRFDLVRADGETTKVEGTQGVDGINPQSQPPTQSRVQSRREQLELWRKQRKETNKMMVPKPPSQPSLTSNLLKRKAVTTAPTSLHQKSWCAATWTDTTPRKRQMPSVVLTKQSLASSTNVKKRPCISLLKQHQPVGHGSMPALRKTRVAGSGKNFKRSPTKPGDGKTHPQVTGSVNDVRRPLTKPNAGQAQQHIGRSRKDLKRPLTKPSSGQEQPFIAWSRNDKKHPLAEPNARKRQTLCLGSTLDRKPALISGSRLPSVKPRPVSQLSTNAPALGTQTQSHSPSRRKSKRFVHVKACVDSNLTAIRSRSRMTCSPRLKHTVVPACGVNPRHSMPAHMKKTATMGLNSKMSIGVLKTHSRMTCSPRLKHTVVPPRGANPRLSMPVHAKKTSTMGLNLKTSVGILKTRSRMTCSPRLKHTVVPSCGVNPRHSMPTHAQKTALMGSKSRKSIVVLHRSPCQVGVDNRILGRQHLTDKGAVKFATPVRAKSAWAKNEVTPACTPLKKEQSMREKFEAWLTSRGKTPSKYSHMMCFGHASSHSVIPRTPASCQRHKQSRVTPGKPDQRTTFSLPDTAVMTDFVQVTDEVTDGQTVGECHPESKTLEGLLSECLQLLQESDCPAGFVQDWLREIAIVPQALHHAKFWIVKAALAEKSGETNDAVVDIFEQAFRHKVEPPEEMAVALKGFVVRMAKRHNDSADASRRSQDIQENMFESSAVKYCMSNTTVFFKRVRSRLVDSPRRFAPHAIITPVRRSTRKSHTTLPIMLQEHDTMYDTLEEVPEDLQPCTLFRPNKALETALEESGEM